MTSYLDSITPPPATFFRIDRGRRYWHRVDSATDLTFTARCGAIGMVAVAEVSQVIRDGEGCPNCERSAT
jgi:hypothetical protein